MDLYRQLLEEQIKDSEWHLDYHTRKMFEYQTMNKALKELYDRVKETEDSDDKEKS